MENRVCVRRNKLGVWFFEFVYLNIYSMYLLYLKDLYLIRNFTYRVCNIVGMGL